MVRAVGYREKVETLGGVPVRITTYQIGEQFFCKIDNLDPGGVIARAWGPDRDSAIENAKAAASGLGTGPGDGK